MAGRSKGKFYCWGDVISQRCLSVECGHRNHAVDSPTECEKCGRPLDYKCRRKLLPDKRCEEHRTLPKGPACWVAPEPPPAPETVAQQMAQSLAPETRKLFGHFLHGMKPHELLHLMAAKTAARAHYKVSRGLMDPEDEAAVGRVVAYTLDKAMRAQLLDKELNPPKVKDASAYDYSKLTPEQLTQLDQLLAIASVEPTADAGGDLAEVKQGAKQTTADALWWPKGAEDDEEDEDDPEPVPVVARKRVRKPVKPAKRKPAAGKKRGARG